MIEFAVILRNQIEKGWHCRGGREVCVQGRGRQCKAKRLGVEGRRGPDSTVYKIQAGRRIKGSGSHSDGVVGPSITAMLDTNYKRSITDPAIPGSMSC